MQTPGKNPDRKRPSLFHQQCAQQLSQGLGVCMHERRKSVQHGFQATLQWKSYPLKNRSKLGQSQQGVLCQKIDKHKLCILPVIHFHATVLSSIQLYKHLCSCDVQTKIEKGKFRMKMRWNITCINMQRAYETHQLFISKCNEVKTKAPVQLLWSFFNIFQTWREKWGYNTLTCCWKDKSTG